MNKVILLGRLAADPELRQTGSGISVTSFTVAVDRTHAKGPDKQTDWIDIVAWRNTAEFVCKYFQKGSPIVIEGSIQTRTYEDKSGQKRKAVEVNAESVEFAPRNAPERVEQQGCKNILPEAKEVFGMPQGLSQGASEDFEQVQMGNEDLPYDSEGKHRLL